MKKIYFLFSLFFFCINIVFADNFDISGKNVILYNMNDYEIIYSKNAEEKTQIASLTKIMTTIVGIENIDDLNKNITFTEKDFEGTTGYSKAGFKVNDKATYLDLLYGIILPSGADAVNALVNNTLGYDEFIKKMNELAKKIGMNNSHFSNPIGKDDEQNYSTAKDLSLLLKYALNNELFKTVFTTKEYTTSNGLNLKSTLNSYSNILDTNKIDGAKSGFTKSAGRCLASITNLNDVSYLLVVINSSTEFPYNAIKDTLSIYDYYNENYSYQNIINEKTVIANIPIKLSKEKNYEVTGHEKISKYLKNDSKITYEYDGIDEIEFNTKKGASIGTVKIFADDNLLTTSEVFLEKDISYYPIINYILIFVGIIVLLLIFKKKKRRKKRRVRR